MKHLFIIAMILSIGGCIIRSPSPEITPPNSKLSTLQSNHIYKTINPLLEPKIAIFLAEEFWKIRMDKCFLHNITAHKTDERNYIVRGFLSESLSDSRNHQDDIEAYITITVPDSYLTRNGILKFAN